MLTMYHLAFSEEVLEGGILIRRAREESSYVWGKCSDVYDSILRFHDRASDVIFQMT